MKTWGKVDIFLEGIIANDINLLNNKQKKASLDPFSSSDYCIILSFLLQWNSLRIVLTENSQFLFPFSLESTLADSPSHLHSTQTALVNVISGHFLVTVLLVLSVVFGMPDRPPALPGHTPISWFHDPTLALIISGCCLSLCLLIPPHLSNLCAGGSSGLRPHPFLFFPPFVSSIFTA